MGLDLQRMLADGRRRGRTARGHAAAEPSEEGGEEHRERRGLRRCEVTVVSESRRRRPEKGLKIDIDNSASRRSSSPSRMVVGSTAGIGAVVIEVSTSSARSGGARSRAPRLQKHGTTRTGCRTTSADRQPERLHAVHLGARVQVRAHVEETPRPGVARAPPRQGRPEGPPRHPLVLSKETRGGRRSEGMSGDGRRCPRWARRARGTDAEAAGAPKFSSPARCVRVMGVLVNETGETCETTRST